MFLTKKEWKKQIEADNKSYSKRECESFMDCYLIDLIEACSDFMKAPQLDYLLSSCRSKREQILEFKKNF